MRLSICFTPNRGQNLELRIHAKNEIAGRIIPFFELGFWDKITGMCAGAMPYHRDF